MLPSGAHHVVSVFSRAALLCRVFAVLACAACNEQSPVNFEIPRGQYTPATLDTRSSQLFMAGLVVDEATGEATSYPRVSRWNQNRMVAGGIVTEISMRPHAGVRRFQVPPADVPR